MALALSPYGEQQPETQYGSQPTPAKKPLATGAASPGAPSASGGLTLDANPDPYATLAGSTGEGNYLGQTIQPGPAVDRVGLATNAWETFANRTDPTYQKTIRDAEGAGAAVGRLGSGQLRTSLGDAAANRQLQLDSARDTLINQAISDSIGDSYKNIEIAQQQQGFQAGQQQTAYAQALAKAQQDLSVELGRGNLGVQKGQLDLAKTGQDKSFGLEEAKLDLAKEGQQDSAQLAKDQLALQAKSLELDEMVRSGQLTLAQKDQTLRELAQSQGNANEGARLQLAKDQMAAEAERFGASQAQQLQLAQLADATANKQIDISKEQGRNQLLVSVANILGGSSGAVPPELLRTVLAALGITYTPGSGVTGTGTGTGTGSTTGTTSTYGRESGRESGEAE